MVTAVISTAPVTMYFTDDENASRFIPLAIEPMTTAPSSADHTEPRPPNRLVPAMTGPAIAMSSRSLPPEDWLTAISREARQDAARRGECRSQHEDDQAHVVDLDAGSAGSFRVAAHREHVPTEPGALGEVGERERQPEHDALRRAAVRGPGSR